MLHAFISATSDVVYRMSADWKEMRLLMGKEFLSDTSNPSQSWIDLYIHPDDQPKVLQAIDHAITTRTMFNLEHRVIRADGTLGWTSSKAVPLLDEKGNITEWFGTATDITHLKESQDRNRRNASHLRMTFESMSEGVCLIERLPTGPDGKRDYRFTTMNMAMQSMFDVPDLTGQTIRQNFPDEIEAWYDDFDHVLKTGQPMRIERESVRQNKFLHVYVTRMEDGNQKQLLVVIQDVTEHVQAEKALRQSEENYRTLFESIDEGYCIIQVMFDEQDQPVDYLFLETNPAFVQHSGLQDAVGKRMRQLEPRHEEYWFEIYGRVARTGEPIRFTHEAKHLDERILSLYAFRVGKPEECKVAVLFTDITQRVKAEQALQRSKEELEQRVIQRTNELRIRADQLARMTTELTLAEQRERRRLARVLHDNLQQLLAGAKFSLQSLRRRLDDSLNEPVDHLESLLNESIQASRSLTVELSPPILHEAGLATGLDWLGWWMEEKHGLTVDLHIDDTVATEREDVRVLLFQAARELLFNIVKHADVKNASLELAAEDDQYLRVTVSDEGKGLDVHDTMQVNRRLEGGFGLFSIQERLAHLGGWMHIHSQPGRGATFTLVAPIHDEIRQAAPDVMPASPVSTPDENTELQLPLACPLDTHDKIRLMLVDDHKVVREGLRSLLQDEAPDLLVVGEAADGLAAIELAHQLQPQVVLMDFSMPRMDGIEATRQLRKEMPEVQVIGLSMYEERDRSAAMMEAGAAAFLTKTSSANVLLETIRKVMEMGHQREANVT